LFYSYLTTLSAVNRHFGTNSLAFHSIYDFTRATIQIFELLVTTSRILLLLLYPSLPLLRPLCLFERPWQLPDLIPVEPESIGGTYSYRLPPQYRIMATDAMILSLIEVPFKEHANVCDESTPAGKIWSSCLEYVRTCPGCQGVFWQARLREPRIIDLLVPWLDMDAYNELVFLNPGDEVAAIVDLRA
jgi:hypothetical protein